jgi:hypothetical protein
MTVCPGIGDLDSLVTESGSPKAAQKSFGIGRSYEESYLVDTGWSGSGIHSGGCGPAAGTTPAGFCPHADLAKMKASQEEAAKAMQGGGQNFQNMSEEERTKMREEFTKRREATQAILTDMDAQIAKLKGRRQLQTAFDEGQTELKAIRDLANEEKATKAAERLGQLIDKNQTKFDDMMKKLGLPEGRQGGQGGQGGQRPAGQ